MGSAVTMGKAWHAHAMRPYLYRHNSPKFFGTLRLEGGQATWSTKALVLLPWEHGSVQGLAPQPV